MTPYGVLALAIFAVTQPSSLTRPSTPMAGEQGLNLRHFDLACSGQIEALQAGTTMQAKPWSDTIVVDLVSHRWASKSRTDGPFRIWGVNDKEIVFTVAGAEAWAFDSRIDRATLSYSEFAPSMEAVKATCTVAPFTGFKPSDSGRP